MSNIERAPQQIVELNETIPTLTEQVFVNRWLLTLRAYMAGEDVKIGLWLQENNITTFTEVSVVNSNGVELYRVPSILMKHESVLPNRVSSQIGDLLYRAENMNKTIPGRGNVFIRNEITAHVNDSDVIALYQKRWDDIFTKYDLLPVFFYNTTSVSDTSDGDFDDYEEL